LFPGTEQCSYRHVLSRRSRNRSYSLLGRMPLMSMISTYPRKIPSISFETFDNSYCRPTARYVSCGKQTLVLNLLSSIQTDCGRQRARPRCALTLSCHRWLLSALQHQAADCLIRLDPGVVVLLRPVLSEKVLESFHQGRSDEGVMLRPDPVDDVPLAQFQEH